MPDRFPRRILCIDDDLKILKFYKGFLAQTDYEVMTASSGEAAIDMLSETAVDLIITDLEMPGTTGFLIVSSIKQLPLHERTPILMCTSHREKEFVDKARHLGCSGYLYKPFMSDDLIYAIENLTELDATASVG